jgi:hypothetical protein
MQDSSTARISGKSLMIATVGVYVVVILVALFFAGLAYQGFSRREQIVTPYTDGGSCEPARTEYIRTARQTCTFVAQVEAARATRVAIERQLVSAQIAAAGLLAGAVAAGFVPGIGPIIAGALMNAYLAAQAYVTFLLGRLASAADSEGRAATEWAAAFRAVADAEMAMFRRCPREEALLAVRDFPPCDPGGETRPLPG